MKIRINKQTLSSLPEPIRGIVEAWRNRWHRTVISLEQCDSFPVIEDVQVTAISADLEVSKALAAGGEWSGVTELAPGTHCLLPPGCTVIVDRIFCGEPFLVIFHNPVGSRIPFLCEAQAKAA